MINFDDFVKENIKNIYQIDQEFVNIHLESLDLGKQIHGLI